MFLDKGNLSLLGKIKFSCNKNLLKFKASIISKFENFNLFLFFNILGILKFLILSRLTSKPNSFTSDNSQKI